MSNSIIKVSHKTSLVDLVNIQITYYMRIQVKQKQKQKSKGELPTLCFDTDKINSWRPCVNVKGWVKASWVNAMNQDLYFEQLCQDLLEPIWSLISF